MTLSTFASVSPEDVATVSTVPLWMQVYCFRRRYLTESLVRRAGASEYLAVVLTVDAPVIGRRPRDVRTVSASPPVLLLRISATTSQDT